MSPIPIQRKAELHAIGAAGTAGAKRRSASKTPPRRWSALLAENGVWYDALADLGRQLARAPDDKGLLLQREILLEQVGLLGVRR